MAPPPSAPGRVAPDSKCRKPLALNANDNLSQWDSNVAMTQRHCAPEPTATNALPPVVASLMQPFREFFTAPVWRHLLFLIAAAVLSPGKRTVSAALRVMALARPETSRAIITCSNHARWSPPRRRRQIAGDYHQEPPAVRAAGNRSRRYDRAPLGTQDFRARRLSRSGSLLARAFRQDQRVALAFRDGPPFRALGSKPLGTTVQNGLRQSWGP